MRNIAGIIDARAFQIAAALEVVDPDSAPQMFISPNTTAAASELFVELHRLLAPINVGNLPMPGEASLERARIVAIQRAFAKFLMQAWRDPRRARVLKYLYRWALLLDQANDGVRHPFLEPKNLGRGGRTVDRIEHWMVRAKACVAFYCFERDGRDMSLHTESLSKIAAAVAKAAPDLSRAMRTPKRDSKRARTAKQELAGAILSWRRSFDQHGAPEIAQTNWQYGIDLADAEAAGNAGGYAKHARMIIESTQASARALPA